MDGQSLEQSDSDSGESWTLLENNSVYADDAPEFIERRTRCEAQHPEEDTDGISIISDSDHETPSPIPPLDHSMINKSHHDENLQADSTIPEYIPVIPELENINEDDQEPVPNDDFLGDSQAKHKTYVHRRNKRLSTVLNIIVLGSVITAAGVAIGHMWGAKNDCTMHTTSSVNKILSNLYKLQEENAYLRSKLKELTFVNNKQKIQPKYNQNRCNRVFEESLSSNEPRKLTKCVDEKNFDLLEHLVKPKFEKEFVADIDKLKTVYLQNKSWLDDEISRRLKIEEELVKKYKNEVNSAKEQKKELLGSKDNVEFKDPELKDPNKESFLDFENPSKDYIQNKVTYADSLQTEHPRFKRDEKRETKDKDKDWFVSNHNINKLNPIKQDLIWNEQSNPKSNLKNDYKESFVFELKNQVTELEQKDTNEYEMHPTFSDNWTEVKPKFRRNEERYEPHERKVLIESVDDKIQGKSKFSKLSSSKDAQEIKNKRKKQKGDSKESSDSWENYSNKDRILPTAFNDEEVFKDDRYVVNMLKQEKKRKGLTVNSNKKQKRKNKHEKWTMKGEFGDKFESVASPGDFVSDYSDKWNNNFDHVTFVSSSNIDNIDGVTEIHKDHRGNQDSKEEKNKSDKTVTKDEKLYNKTDKKEQGADWFEKRAVFRTEARKKYYEQFRYSTPNNSSWYFRRMRKREQCRAKGDNSTFRKIYKEKRNNDIKH